MVGQARLARENKRILRATNCKENMRYNLNADASHWVSTEMIRVDPIDEIFLKRRAQT